MKFFTTLFTTLTVALAVSANHSVNKTASKTANKTSLGLAPFLSNTNTTSLPTSSNSLPNTLAAVLPNSLSKDCAAALLTLVVNPEFVKCIPPTALIALVPLISDPNKLKQLLSDPAKFYKPLAEKPLIAFADGICVKQCSTDLITSAIKTVSDGCKAELEAKDPLISAVFSSFVLYFPLQTSICFKDKNTYCFDESILNIISLPASKFPPVAKNPTLDAVIVGDPNKICTQCNKEIIQTIITFIDKNGSTSPVKEVLAGLGLTDQVYGQFKFGVAVKCGQSFELDPK